MATIYFQTQLDSTNKLNADLLDDTSSTNKLVTEAEKTEWDSKYDKPASGIPSTDMTTAVQTDLAKGASAIQTITSKNVTDALGYTPLDGAKKGAANGVAELGADGKVPTAQLPSYVDDVVEGYYYNNKFYADAEHTIEITPETGKIYVDLSTNKTYRWGGSAYVEISASLALGETSETAYRGDRGKVAYDHSQTTTGNPHGVTFAQLSDKPTALSQFTNDSGFITSSYHDSTKQDTLVSGTNIKTINQSSVVGSGDLSIPTGTDVAFGSNDDIVVQPSTGTVVVANPTITGTEPDLSGLQVGSTIYKVPSGGGSALYLHSMTATYNGTTAKFHLINGKSTPYTKANLASDLYSKYFSVSAYVYYGGSKPGIILGLASNSYGLYYFNDDTTTVTYVSISYGSLSDTVTELTS